MQKLLTFFVSKNINVYAIVNDQSFNDTFIYDIFSFEQMGPDKKILRKIDPLKKKKKKKRKEKKQKKKKKNKNKKNNNKKQKQKRTH